MAVITDSIRAKSIFMDGFQTDLIPADGSLGQPRVFRKGTVLWNRDQSSDRLFLVLRGEIEILVPGHNFHETVTRMVKPGELCGLFCLSKDRRAPTSGRAHVRCEAIEIRCDELFAYLQREPRAALGLLAATSERLAFAEERIHVLAQRGGEDRIIALLLQLARRSGYASTAHPGFKRVQHTHEELARLSGMNRAHVSVVLNRLRAKDLIRYGRGKPTLIDAEAMLRYAQSKPRPGTAEPRGIEAVSEPIATVSAQ